MNDNDSTAIGDDGGLAWPRSSTVAPGRDVQYGGMSLRDWYIGQALAGLAADPVLKPERIGTLACEMADAVLAARQEVRP